MSRRRRRVCDCGHHNLPLFQDLDAAGAMKRDPEDDAPPAAAAETPASESVSADLPGPSAKAVLLAQLATSEITVPVFTDRLAHSPDCLCGQCHGPELDAREVWDSLVTPRPGLATRVRGLGRLRESPRSPQSSDRSRQPWGGILDDDPPPAA